MKLYPAVTSGVLVDYFWFIDERGKKGLEMTLRKCPVCGKNVNGRSDKKFCSDECRIFYNNALGRRRRARNHKQLKSIRSNIMELERVDAKVSLRILSWISKVFKIMSTFAKDRYS